MKTLLTTFLMALALALPPGAVIAAQQSHDSQKHLMQLQERMKTMQEQMSSIQQTTDPAERNKLMQEHMKTMQEQMKDMRGMGGGMMMGMMGHRGDKMHQKGTMDREKREQMMRGRMDMMQLMMEQMMERMQVPAN